MSVGAGRGHRVLAAVVVTLTALTVAGGCTQTIPGRGSAGIDTETVGGLPVQDGPSGLKEGVPDARLDVQNADGGAVDRLATNAIADVQQFWSQRFPEDFDTEYEPIRRLVSYDSRQPRGVTVCGANTAGVANAFYCPPEDTIAWDRGALLPTIVEALETEMAAVLVLAHEMGHAVQTRLEIVDRNTPTIVAEQQADCFAGVFMRHVAEGGSEHFQLSTGDGLNAVLAGLLAIRDQVGAALTGRGAHGTSFDRVIAFQFGFVEGARRCAEIDVDEVRSRATELPFQNEQEEATQGNLPINEESLQEVVESLQETPFTDPPPDAPKIAFEPGDCADAEPTPPASYCPANNTISLDVPALAELATPRNQQLDTDVTGDFTALGLVASRYGLAVRRHLDRDLEGPRAGLHAACLVGTWAGLHLETPFGNRNPVGTLRMSPGDLDEAVSELLKDGLMASDVNGEAVKSGFARVEAFRVGFLQGAEPCASRFR
jgi:predicted metalloprotease